MIERMTLGIVNFFTIDSDRKTVKSFWFYFKDHQYFRFHSEQEISRRTIASAYAYALINPTIM